MTKAQHGNKESKKQPAMTLKEKRTAKKSKKNAKVAVPQPLVAR
jgi:hypothetical protein